MRELSLDEEAVDKLLSPAPAVSSKKNIYTVPIDDAEPEVHYPSDQLYIDPSLNPDFEEGKELISTYYWDGRDLQKPANTAYTTFKDPEEVDRYDLEGRAALIRTPESGDYREIIGDQIGVSLWGVINT